MKNVIVLTTPPQQKHIIQTIFDGILENINSNKFYYIINFDFFKSSSIRCDINSYVNYLGYTCDYFEPYVMGGWIDVTHIKIHLINK